MKPIMEKRKNGDFPKDKAFVDLEGKVGNKETERKSWEFLQHNLIWEGFFVCLFFKFTCALPLSWKDLKWPTANLIP